jgi:hypothetical protein
MCKRYPQSAVARLLPRAAVSLARAGQWNDQSAGSGGKLGYGAPVCAGVTWTVEHEGGGTPETRLTRMPGSR